jgi:SAM-dependent methyltransferase
MKLQPFEIDSSNMPVCLGSALRVPGYAYPEWGIEGDRIFLDKESDRQYEIEWKSGSKKQMDYVIEAITDSGLGNYSQMLRDANAELVSRIVQKSKEKVNYLELGAGESTVNVYQRLKSDAVDLERVFGTLVEPSKQRLELAAVKLEKMGLKRGKNFKINVSKDTDIPKFVEPNSQDITSYVAVLHHHAYLDTPIKIVYNHLKNNGLLLVGDWHNAMWEHPNRVYELLRDEFEWSTKEQDLEAFVRAYPKALEKAPELPELDAASNRHIKRFWKSWENVRKREIDAGIFRHKNDILMLEAHRPVERQNEAIERVGYRLDTPAIRELQNPNPRRLIPDAGILYVTIGQK